MSEEAVSRRNSSRATIKDVAEMAGVSTATVSYVLNNRGKVGPATKDKVHAAMRVLNWAPDPSARHLAMQSREARWHEIKSPGNT